MPRLRRELADYYGGPQGVLFYYNAITLDRQQLRPDGPADHVATVLAVAEATRLRQGDLWYVDTDLCALLAAAHRSMPAFAPRPDDLPSPWGFVVFAEPIATRSSAEDIGVEDLVDQIDPGHDPKFRTLSARIGAEPTQIMAASWGPIDNPNWPAGGLWMSFYTPTRVRQDGVFDDELVQRRAAAMLPVLTVDNEAALAWRPEGDTGTEYLLPGPDQPETTLTWARVVFAAFQLAAQTNLAETETRRTARPEWRRSQRAGLPDRDVRVIRLHRALADARDAEHPDNDGTAWRHRWVVRGHWRNQWYPSLTDHRPKWIAPYLKGPTDAPLLGGEKVTIVNTPPQQPADPDSAPGRTEAV